MPDYFRDGQFMKSANEKEKQQILSQSKLNLRLSQSKKNFINENESNNNFCKYYKPERPLTSFRTRKIINNKIWY